MTATNTQSAQQISVQFDEIRKRIFSELEKAYWPFNHVFVFIAKMYLKHR